MGGASGARSIILGNDLVDRGRQVQKEVILEVPGGASEVSMVGLCQLCDAVDEGEEVRTEAPEGPNDTKDDGFTLAGWVACHFVLLSGIRRKAGCGKGSRSIP